MWRNGIKFVEVVAGFPHVTDGSFTESFEKAKVFSASRIFFDKYSTFVTDWSELIVLSVVLGAITNVLVPLTSWSKSVETYVEITVSNRLFIF